MFLIALSKKKERRKEKKEKKEEDQGKERHLSIDLPSNSFASGNKNNYAKLS